MTAILLYTESLYQPMQISRRGKMQFFQFPAGIQKQALFRTDPDSSFGITEQRIYQYILQLFMLFSQRMLRKFAGLFVEKVKSAHTAYPKRSICSV